MNRRRVLIGIAFVTAVFVLAGISTIGSPKIVMELEEKVDCTVCHVKEGEKLLTDQGKYYETLRTLEGYDKLTEKFGNCSHCHKRYPGSKKLTKEGKRVRRVVRDMEGLFEWLKEGHTGSPGDPE